MICQCGHNQKEHYYGDRTMETPCQKCTCKGFAPAPDEGIREKILTDAELKAILHLSWKERGTDNPCIDPVVTNAMRNFCKAQAALTASLSAKKIKELEAEIVALKKMVKALELACEGDLENKTAKTKLQAAEQETKVVCLCGSTRFGKAFDEANLNETLAGRIVLTIGCNMRDDDLFKSIGEEAKRQIKTMLDELHKRKIDLSDEILVLNVGGYIGESTRSEIDYAITHGKPVKYLEPLAADRKASGQG